MSRSNAAAAEEAAAASEELNSQAESPVDRPASLDQLVTPVSLVHRRAWRRLAS